MYLLVACGLVATATASHGFLKQSDEGLDSLFNMYLARQGKSYSTKEEYLRRRDIFESQV